MHSVFDRVKAATVALAIIDIDNQRAPFKIVGSGFCVDADGVVITCEHVVSAFMEKSIPQQIIEIPDGEKHKRLQKTNPFRALTPQVIFFRTDPSSRQLFATVARVENVVAKTNYDLAAVRIAPHTSFPEGYPFIDLLNYDQVHEGIEIGTCGFPLGTFLQEQLGTLTSSFTRGIVSSISPYQGVPLEHLKLFQLDLLATYGNSGGPVFSAKDGRYFGVLQGGVMGSDGKLLQGMSKAEPVYPLLENDLLTRIKIKLTAG